MSDGVRFDFLIPSDWENPDWDNLEKCHEWKRYVDFGVQKIWDTFSDKQKQELSQNYKGMADREEWD